MPATNALIWQEWPRVTGAISSPFPAIPVPSQTFPTDARSLKCC